MGVRDLSLTELVERARTGDRRAIGRVLTLVERGGPTADEITELTHPATTGAHVVGITGAPGAGKSTLTGRLIRHLPSIGRKPAVLAVDPSSPLTGGAILGDRVRMDDVAGDGGFIRSVATRGHAGGLALAVPGCVRAFDACGFDPVLVETVGVGQVEVEAGFDVGQRPPGDVPVHEGGEQVHRGVHSHVTVAARPVDGGGDRVPRVQSVVWSQAVQDAP